MEHDLFGKPASTFPDHALAFCEIHVARGTVRSGATSTGAVEFGEILIIKFRTERAVKRIPLTAPAFLQNIRRPIWFDSSIEDL